MVTVLWLLIISSLIGLFFLTDAQPLGTVKLECQPAPAIVGSVGYVTLYQPDLESYVPVCFSGINRATAAAVCRQLGFVDAKPFANGDYVTPPSKYYNCDEPHMNVTNYITQILCPNVSNYVKQGELHVMRCFIGNLTKESCDVAVIQCNTEYLQDSAEYIYDGQVHLDGIDHYRGIAEVRVSDQFYRLCWDSFDSYTAASICRQLGYTSAASYSRVLNIMKESVNLNSKLCNKNSGSFPCFSHCINSNDYNITKCNEVQVVCDFLKKEIAIQSAGSRGQCKLEQQQASSADAIRVVAGLSVGIGVMGLGFVLYIAISTCIFIVVKKRGHRGGEDGGQDHDEGGEDGGQDHDEGGDRQPFNLGAHGEDGQ